MGQRDRMSDEDFLLSIEDPGGDEFGVVAGLTDKLGGPLNNIPEFQDQQPNVDKELPPGMTAERDEEDDREVPPSDKTIFDSRQQTKMLQTILPEGAVREGNMSFGTRPPVEFGGRQKGLSLMSQSSLADYQGSGEAPVIASRSVMKSGGVPSGARSTAPSGGSLVIGGRSVGMSPVFASPADDDLDLSDEDGADLSSQTQPENSTNAAGVDALQPPVNPNAELEMTASSNVAFEISEGNGTKLSVYKDGGWTHITEGVIDSWGLSLASFTKLKVPAEVKAAVLKNKARITGSLKPTDMPEVGNLYRIADGTMFRIVSVRGEKAVITNTKGQKLVADVAELIDSLLVDSTKFISNANNVTTIAPVATPAKVNTKNRREVVDQSTGEVMKSDDERSEEDLEQDQITEDFEQSRRRSGPRASRTQAGAVKRMIEDIQEELGEDATWEQAEAEFNKRAKARAEKEKTAATIEETDKSDGAKPGVTSPAARPAEDKYSPASEKMMGQSLPKPKGNPLDRAEQLSLTDRRSEDLYFFDIDGFNDWEQGLSDGVPVSEIRKKQDKSAAITKRADKSIGGDVDAHADEWEETAGVLRGTYVATKSNDFVDPGKEFTLEGSYDKELGWQSGLTINDGSDLHDNVPLPELEELVNSGVFKSLAATVDEAADLSQHQYMKESMSSKKTATYKQGQEVLVALSPTRSFIGHAVGQSEDGAEIAVQLPAQYAARSSAYRTFPSGAVASLRKQARKCEICNSTVHIPGSLCVECKESQPVDPATEGWDRSSDESHDRLRSKGALSAMSIQNLELLTIDPALPADLLKQVEAVLALRVQAAPEAAPPTEPAPAEEAAPPAGIGGTADAATDAVEALRGEMETALGRPVEFDEATQELKKRQDAAEESAAESAAIQAPVKAASLRQGAMPPKPPDMETPPQGMKAVFDEATQSWNLVSMADRGGRKTLLDKRKKQKDKEGKEVMCSRIAEGMILRLSTAEITFTAVSQALDSLRDFVNPEVAKQVVDRVVAALSKRFGPESVLMGLIRSKLNAQSIDTNPQNSTENTEPHQAINPSDPTQEDQGKSSTLDDQTSWSGGVQKGAGLSLSQVGDSYDLGKVTFGSTMIPMSGDEEEVEHTLAGLGR